MVTSPLAQFANATIFVPVLGDEVGENPVTGNWEVIGGSTVPYRCYLKKPKSNSVDYEVGLDRSTLLLEGYLVEPKIFPPSINPPLTLELHLEQPNGELLKGDLELAISYSSGVNVEAIVGQKISGIFRITGKGD